MENKTDFNINNLPANESHLLSHPSSLFTQQSTNVCHKYILFIPPKRGVPNNLLGKHLALTPRILTTYLCLSKGVLKKKLSDLVQ